MTNKPILSLPEKLQAGTTCPVCTHSPLRVVHVSEFPDYIECPECGSAYVLGQDQQHLLYGKISGSYPETRKAVLKKWTRESAVRSIAEMERPSTPPVDVSAPRDEPAASQEPSAEPPMPEAREPVQEIAESEIKPSPEAESDAASEPPPAEKVQDEPAVHSRFSALWKEEPIPEPGLLLEQDDGASPEPAQNDTGKETRRETLPEPAQGRGRSSGQPEHGLERAPVFVQYSGESIPETSPDDKGSGPSLEESAPQIERKVHEPVQGKRNRVVLSGSQINFPYKVCSHCLNSPASSSLSMTAFLPDAEDAKRRVPTQIRIPLCSSCRKRASAQSEEERKDRSKAFLYSSGSSLLLILILIVSGILESSAASSAILSIFLILIAATIGFSVPLLILLERSSRLPPPEDALYVLSTLYMPPSPPQNLTIFDWRSRGYAELFHLANRASTVKTVHEVEDQGPRTSPPPETRNDLPTSTGDES